VRGESGVALVAGLLELVVASEAIVAAILGELVEKNSV
jgi:hypothetical protein